MLILFDIDATLLVTARSGILAMEEAGQSLYGSSFGFRNVSFAGRLDPLIVADLFAANGVENTPENRGRFKREYLKRLPTQLDRPDATRALPGVHRLLAELRGREGLVLGVLTGNYEEAGLLKLQRAGIDATLFRVRVWGCECSERSPSRRDLPPLGLARYERAVGRRPARTVIVGDTPHDVDCALAHGCECLGVATGLHSEEDLRSAGATRVVRDLSDTPEIVRFLLQEP